MKRRATADTDATAVESQEPQLQPPSLKTEPDRPPKRRRQPAYSCDFCRSKKLKCSGHPCSSCVSRGLQCVGGGDGGAGVGNLAWASRIQPGRLHVIEAGQSHGRPELPILIQTVVAPGPGSGSGSGDSGPPVTITVTVTGPGSTQIQQQQQQQPSQQHQHGGPHPPSNSLAVPGVPARAPTGAAPLVSTPARIDTAGQVTADFLDSAYTQGVCGSGPRTGGTLARVIADGTLMTHDVAHSLLHMFVNNPCHLLVVIHEPSVRSLMDSFYSCLAGIRHASSTDSAVTKLNPWHAALILSIAATSAALLDEGMLGSSGCSFTSAEEATLSSLAWGRAAQQILEEARETAAMGSTSLEEVQARAILAYLVYNREGYSARFRFLHSCSVAAAREAGLHVVESGRAAAEEPSIDRVTRREIKRRLWWHITATDWMSGVMGGPFDGSYTIHPRHMRTRLPRNLNDNDLSALAARRDADTVTFPLNVPTQMSCFLQRIRLAEICRSIIDAREPSHPDEDVLSCTRALELDSLFRSALDDFPPFMRLDAPVPPGAPCHFPLQRAIINIAFHSRRARLHRPFLLNGYQSWPAHNAPTHDGRQREQYQQCRITCLDSARAVVEIVVALFEASLTQAKSDQAAGAGAGFPSSPSSHGRPLAHRFAIFISHLFAACTVLACALHAPKTTETTSDKAATNELVIKEDLSRACRVLEAAGRESPVAARLVQALTNSLRPSRDKNATATDGLDDRPVHYPHVSCADSAPASTSANFTSVRGHHPGVVPAGGNAQTQAHVGGGGRAGAYADAGGNPGIVDFGLDALWSDIPGMLGSADNWDELFSSIDSSC